MAGCERFDGRQGAGGQRALFTAGDEGDTSEGQCRARPAAGQAAAEPRRRMPAREAIGRRSRRARSPIDFALRAPRSPRLERVRALYWGRSTVSSRVVRVVLVAMLATASGVWAQAPQGGGRGGRGGAGQTVEKIRQLKPDLHLITGGGANTLVRVTPDGLIVVDTKNPGDENYNRLMEEIRSASTLPVRYVINTQHHPDHVGNNQKFIDAGAMVVALEALKTHMASDPRTKAIPGLPTETFARDHVVKLGGAEVRLQSFGRGHSGGDTIVYFPDTKVVMVSDQITDGTPIVDFANGGRALGWTQNLDGVLALDFESAIPGRGEPKTRAEVQAYRDRFASLVSRAAEAIKAGATRDQLATQVKTDDLGWQFNPQFFGQLHDELTRK
jgi:glyoxylase-like metal-dependent hydrolase (beta-lactamase superfamily II)